MSPSSSVGKYVIRLASEHDDMEALSIVFEAARRIMAESGNPNQWNPGYPSADRIVSDIVQKGGYVIENEKGDVVGYFAFLPSPEPTYATIYDGCWVDNELPYHVIHRMASFPHVHGIFTAIMDFCKERENNIRIDTHADNHIMQHNILKHGFRYCGIIHLASGDERLAYQYLKGKTQD